MPVNKDYTTLYGGGGSNPAIPPRQDTASDPNRPGGTYGATQPTAPTAPTVPSTNPASTPTVQTPIVQPASDAMATASAQGSYGTQGANLPATPDYTQQINDIYDRALAAQRGQLDADYAAVMRQIDAAAQQIPAQYQARGNDLNEQYERQRAAMNEQMAANGLNVGTGSQAQLAQNAGYQRAYGQIMAAQADAQAALEQQRVSKETEYQAAITQALADNDYRRAVALTQELKDQRNADLDRAKTLASYGDFSGYAQVYGQDAANNMREVWNAQNPDFAYMTGNLSADQYYRLTGKMPNGTQASGGYGGYTSTTGDGNTTDDNLRDIPVPGGTPGTAAAPTNRLMDDLGRARTEQEFVDIANRLNAQGNLTAAQQQAIMDRYDRLYGDYYNRLYGKGN